MRKLTVAPAILLIVFLVKLVYPFHNDPDFYWHIKTGEEFLTSGSLHAQDVFAFTSSPTAGVLAEWLSQLVLFLVFKAGGLPGVDLFVAAIITLYCAITYRTCLKLLAGDEGKAILITLAACIIASVVAPRPHLFTFLFFAILLSLLVDLKYFGDARRLWLIPPLFLLWANLHGGYFIGLALLGTFLASEWLQRRLRGDSATIARPLLARLTFFAIAGVIVTAVNPHHFGYWLYPFKMLFASSDMNSINEWLSPDFHQPFPLYFLLLVFLFFLALLNARKKFDLTEIVLPSMFIAAAFISQRNLPLAGLVIAPFLALAVRHLPFIAGETNPIATAEGAGSPPSLAAVSRQLGDKEAAINWLFLLAASAALALSYPAQVAKAAKASEAAFPAAAVDFIEQHDIRGRMFNTHHHGGYLIYRLHPGRQVFLYGRHDVFPEGFMKEYADIYLAAPNWRPLFAKHQIDYVLCENSAALRQVLLAGKDFKLVYEDEHNSVLLRDTPQFQVLIERYGRQPSETTPRKEQP